MIQRAPIRVTISTTRCNGTRPRAIAQTIPGAKAMVWTAITWMLSQGRSNRARVDYLLRKNFRSASSGTFEHVKDRLVSMYSGLQDAQSGRSTFDCAPASDPECAGRPGYVLVDDRSMHLCDAFYGTKLLERQWTLVHDFAHVKGVLGSHET